MILLFRISVQLNVEPLIALAIYSFITGCNQLDCFDKIVYFKYIYALYKKHG